MRGKSTSQHALSRDQQKPEIPSFDLNSWQGLTAVLKAGKEVMPEAQVYAAFRNLILSYTQKGGDVEVRKQIDAVLAALDNPEKVRTLLVQNTSSQETSDSEVETITPQRHSMSMRRRQPVFGTARSQSRTTLPKVHRDAASVPTASTIVVETPIPVVVPPVPPPPPKIVIVQETTPSPVPFPVDPPEQAPVVYKSIEEHKTRIATIKRAVHAHMGNPAALVDMHNTAGKTYMNALLSALKATSPGSGMDADSAMMQLESAYEALMHDTPHVAPVAVPTPISVTTPPQPVPVPEPIPEEIIPVTPPSVVVSPVSPVEVIPQTIPVPEEPERESPAVVEEELVVDDSPIIEEVGPEPIRAVPEISSETSDQESDSDEEPPAVEKKRSVFRAIDLLRAKRNVEKNPTPQANSPIPDQDTKRVEVSELNTIPDQETVAVQQDLVQTPSYTERTTREEIHEDIRKARAEVDENMPHPVSGVAARSLDEVKKELGLDASLGIVNQTELHAPEITKALSELLHEWSIFEGSGFLGIGPGGDEHPLYKQLAPLTMNEVVSGRWDGSDPKVRKVIKEYVDAWRHEQAVSYTESETFEHYLRRVVQRILKRKAGQS